MFGWLKSVVPIKTNDLDDRMAALECKLKAAQDYAVAQAVEVRNLNMRYDQAIQDRDAAYRERDKARAALQAYWLAALSANEALRQQDKE